MLTTDEAAELRALQRRAYARDSGLSAEEAARLQELEARRVVTHVAGTDGAVTDSAVTDTPVADVVVTGVEGSAVTGAAEEPSLTADGVTASDQASDGSAALEEARTPHRRRWLPAVLTVAALGVGLGLGWLLLGGGATAIALSLSTAGARAELEEDGRFDAGSIVPLEEKYGTIIWYATAEDGRQECLIMTIEDRESRNCGYVEDMEQAAAQLYASIEVDGEDPDAPAVISAMLLRDGAGSPTLYVQKEEAQLPWDWRSQYSDEELVIAEALVAEGRSGESLQIVGYDGDTPIWLDWTSGETCILAVIDTVVTQECGAPGDDLALVVPSADDGDAVTTYIVAQHDSRGPMLTIEKSIPADSLVQDGVDDKTGESE